MYPACMGRDAYELQGQNGGLVVVDTDSHSPPVGTLWKAVYCLTDTVIGVIDCPADHALIPDNHGALAGLTLPAGTTVFGAFNIVQLTSGAVICYL